MTKIEERAKQWSENHFDEEFAGAAFISYVKAANEQRAIDIDKACSEVEEMLSQAKRLGIHSINHLVANFRKAMEE